MKMLPAVPASTNPHYERVGGAPAVHRLVEAFYGAMDTREDARTLRAMHPQDLSSTKAVLFSYFTEWLGGPRLYSAERGPPRLRRVHQPFAVDAEASRAWLACMDQALQEIGLAAPLRDELHRAFSRIAAHIENTPHPVHHRSTP